MQSVINKLLMNQTRKSTSNTYMRIWRQFNKFVINLDRKPTSWEEHVTLFMGNLIEKGMQSSTVKTYVSAIKKILTDDGYEWNDNKILLTPLTRACRLVNDRVKTRLGITRGLLELLLFELERIYSQNSQLYLEILYKAILVLGYYSLMRVGELTFSCHVAKAANVHVAMNKCKILVVLYSSKTHSKANRPQKIKITKDKNAQATGVLNFCPFNLLKNYVLIREHFYDSEQDPFFVFSDGSPVYPKHIRAVLKLLLDRLGLDSSCYGVHSLRIGRASELIKYHDLEFVKRAGRWQSNIVFKYIRD